MKLPTNMPGSILYTAILLLAACSNTPDPTSTAAGVDLPPVTTTPTAIPAVDSSAITYENKTIKAPPAVATRPVKPVVQQGQKPAAPLPDTTASMVLSTVVTPEAGVQISHSGLDSLLQKHVTAAGKVHYKGLKADKAALDAYCQMLSENPVQEVWSREVKMAYWINAYNAFTLHLIVNNYPTKSILNFDGGKTWDVRRIRIGEKKYSLNNLENDILRPEFKDPRIHFALNCAAKSCPPIWNHAYTAENLEAALESRTRAFINNPAFNTLSAARAQVSKIFEWYGADFGNLREFLNRYAEQPVGASAVIRFQEYDWGLNE